MPKIAIIGSGPAGYYTAEAGQKRWGDNASIDIFDALPVPYGLIRTGVAPDHQSIKGVARRYEKTALSSNVRFVGNVYIGRDVSVPELLSMYDAVVLATGAPNDRPLNLPGDDLANVMGSAAFVGWYNGHPAHAELNPDLSGKHAIVIGMGNVALDVARILAKTESELEGSDIVNHALKTLLASNIERITVLGRRGPLQIMMTPKELGELAHLERAQIVVDPADFPPEEADEALEPGRRKSVKLLRGYAADAAPAEDEKHEGKTVTIGFTFYRSPHAMLGSEKVEEVEIERTELEDGRAIRTGELSRLAADIVISCIGYRTSPIPDVPFDERAGRFANEEGRIAPGLYCVGWARRGPSGTIGTNRPDGYDVVDKIAEDLEAAPTAEPLEGRAAFDTLAKERGLEVVTFRDWQKIDEAEQQAAREGAPREKFVDIEAMIKAGSGA